MYYEQHTWQGTFVRVMLSHQNLLHTLHFTDLLYNLKRKKNYVG